MTKYILFALLLVVEAIVSFWIFSKKPPSSRTTPNLFTISSILPLTSFPKITPTPLPTSTPTPTPTLPPIPPTKILENSYHVFQTFNNCGPAALSMALSYYGINKTQQDLGQDLRPYQIPLGNNDDKSVTLDELAQKAAEFNFIPIHRPDGNAQLIKQFIASGMPVITRTLLYLHNDIGHYRVVKGYDDGAQEFMQDDSLQGQNLRYSYTEFSGLWNIFQNEYLVLVPKDKEQTARAIVGEDMDEKIAWTKTVATARKNLAVNPDDVYSRFNLSVALYHVGDFKNAVLEFEKVENKLPFRTLWYQIEPIQAYYELGNYPRVFEITDQIINNQNRAFSELYIIRGEIYKKQGNKESAKSEFEKAVYYNKNLKSAQEALLSVQ